MAIDYYLMLGTPKSVRQVADALRDTASHLDLLDPTVTTDELLANKEDRNGTILTVSDCTPRWPWDVVRDELGFTPTVSVGFRLDKFRSLADQEDDIVRLTSALLDCIPGDAVLHWDYEQIWLLRRDGELSLNERTDIWPPHRLALITQPYQRATHAFS
jgi:hypothetical protein